MFLFRKSHYFELRSFLIFILLGFLNIFFHSCKHDSPKQITNAFYYWRSEFKLDSTEKSYLADAGSNLLYIRFFDVVWNVQLSQPAPDAPLYFAQKPDSFINYIPVVFITNETMQHISTGQINELANHILEKIESISKNFIKNYHEVQMDCDWTVGTKDKYFLLLQNLRQQLHANHIKLSVTVRLHQIKYIARTGIPPADRGMLMFYNMGDWKDPQTSNSIYDLRIAAKYISHLDKYPLPLDIALPLLRWTIIYRNRKFLTFSNYIAKDELIHCDFLDQLSDPNKFVVKKDTFAFGCNFRKNDLLRSETCEAQEILEGEKQLLQRISNPKITIALFHLDDQLLNHYSHAEIKEIFNHIQ
ncbi:MAG: hypothetical protein ACRDE2_01695 [Chitinophagaceae bacterium]